MACHLLLALSASVLCSVLPGQSPPRGSARALAAAWSSSSACAQAGSLSSSRLCPKDTSSGGSSRPRGPLGLPLLLSVPSLLASSLTRIPTVIILLDHCAPTAWPPHEHGSSIRAGTVGVCPVGCRSPAPGTASSTEQDESMEKRCQTWSKKKLRFLGEKRCMRKILY